MRVINKFKYHQAILPSHGRQSNHEHLIELRTMSLYRGIHDPVFDLHMSAEVALQVELAGAVRTLEGLAAGVEMHVAEEVVHSVEGLATHLPDDSTIVSTSSQWEPLCLHVSFHLLHSPCI